jgi:hypothetical protein
MVFHEKHHFNTIFSYSWKAGTHRTLPNSQESAAATQQPTLSHTHTHKHTHFTKTLTSLSVSKQASIEQVGSVIRDAAEQKKKGRKNK